MVNVNTALRTAQTLLTIPVIGLNAYVTHWYKTHTVSNSAPQATMVPLAVGAISLLAMLYLFFNAPLQITRGHRQSNPRFFNKWAVLGLDGLLAALWFVAWVREAPFRASLTLCFSQICNFMAVATTLGALTGMSFIATTVLAVIHVSRTRHADFDLPQFRKTHADWVGVVGKEKAETEK